MCSDSGVSVSVQHSLFIPQELRVLSGQEAAENSAAGCAQGSHRWSFSYQCLTKLTGSLAWLAAGPSLSFFSFSDFSSLEKGMCVEEGQEGTRYVNQLFEGEG